MKENVQRLAHQFKEEIKKIVGRPLFELSVEEDLREVQGAIERVLVDYFSRVPPFEYDVKTDPDDPSKAIVTITAKNALGEKMLLKYLDELERSKHE